VYNRGVEKRSIFLDTQDYVVFRHYLKSYLLPPDHPSQKQLPRGLLLALQRCDLSRRVALLAYCLMPNHFHLVIKQLDEEGMKEFVKRLSNAYVAYFNRRYERVGSLFQGPYRAVLIEGGGQALYLTRYLHRDALELLASQGITTLEDYPYSSYAEYLGRRTTEWLSAGEILSYLPELQENSPGISTYQQFVEDDRAEADCGLRTADCGIPKSVTRNRDEL
jgi:putative transposase